MRYVCGGEELEIATSYLHFASLNFIWLINDHQLDPQLLISPAKDIAYFAIQQLRINNHLQISATRLQSPETFKSERTPHTVLHNEKVWDMGRRINQALFLPAVFSSRTK